MSMLSTVRQSNKANTTVFHMAIERETRASRGFYMKCFTLILILHRPKIPENKIGNNAVVSGLVCTDGIWTEKTDV